MALWTWALGMFVVELFQSSLIVKLVVVLFDGVK